MSTTRGSQSRGAILQPAARPRARASGGNRSLVLPVSLSLLTGAALYPWLPRISTWLAYRVFALERGTHLGSAVEFFVYEAPKVLLLLAFVVFSIGILRTYITPERTRALLAGRNETVGNVLAASLGIATPFCSCSAVPLFIGFLTAGIPLGVTFSFLIAAPMVNEVALALLFGLFGWKVAGLYLATGLMVAIISGWVIGRLRLERHVEPWVYATHLGRQATPNEPPTRGERIHAGLDAVREIGGSVWPFVLVGIAVGAGIHGWVPENFMASFMGKGVWWSVPLAVLLGIPMYSNAAGIIPVVHSLLEKGAALGTVLAFMMAVVALSLPEVIILRRVLRPVLMGAFVGIVALGIILVGYLFNAFI